MSLDFLVPNGVYELEVQTIKHYTSRLFSFTTDRPQEFRFRSGEFVMIGLPSEKPVWRAYSIASPNWLENLEFFSIKVPDGPLTSKLQLIQPKDKIWIRKKSTGTLVMDALLPAKRLFLFATGTGFAPFASIIREPEAYEKFAQIHAIHTTREAAELQYSQELVKSLYHDEFLSEMIGDKLHLHDYTTRENSKNMGRITDLILNGQFYKNHNIAPLNPSTDRAMICGSMAMLLDIKKILQDLGFNEGSNSAPGDFVIEKAFAD